MRTVHYDISLNDFTNHISPPDTSITDFVDAINELMNAASDGVTNIFPGEL